MARRGTYRALYSALFDDPDFQMLEPDSRLMLLTLRLCSDAGAAAIFRYYPEKLAAQTGLSLQGVNRALDRLASLGWIVVSAPIVWVKNGLRYDPTVSLSNRKHAEHVTKWLAGLPKAEIVLTFCDYYQIAYPFDRLSHQSLSSPIPIPIPIPIPSSEAPALPARPRPARHRRTSREPARSAGEGESSGGEGNAARQGPGLPADNGHGPLAGPLAEFMATVRAASVRGTTFPPPGPNA